MKFSAFLDLPAMLLPPTYPRGQAGDVLDTPGVPAKLGRERRSPREAVGATTAGSRS